MDSLVELDEKLRRFNGDPLTSSELDDLHIRDELVIIKKSVMDSAAHLQGSLAEQLVNKLDAEFDALLSSGVPDSDAYKAAEDGGHEARYAYYARFASLAGRQHAAVRRVRDLCEELRLVLQEHRQEHRPISD